MLADRVRADPELTCIAKSNIQRWLQTCSPRLRGMLVEWDTALHASPDEVISLLTGTDERAVRLRQSNPFAGVQERTEVLRNFHSDDTRACHPRGGRHGEPARHRRDRITIDPRGIANSVA